MKTYTLTPEAQEAFNKWYNNRFTPEDIQYDGIDKTLKAFFKAHPEYLTEQPSTLKRDEVLKIATALMTGRKWLDPIDYKSVVSMAETLQAEVDKRFNHI